MNKELLLQIFKAPYNRQSFIDNVLLPTVQGKVDNLEIYDQYGAQEVDLTASEEQYAKSAVKYGEFTTRDEIGRTVELYEVVLHDHKQVERSRVGIAALIKKQIIGNNAVLVNFAYENPQNRSWRFSFIAHDAIFSDGEMVRSETNPKRYTYVFGEPDETYRTALERFYTLGHEYSITVELLKDAFGVEAMSKAFFDEYRDIHYNGFVDYLTRSNFKQSVFNGDEKAIRDFVKKLLGRIVFLYFIQKKGWLGASNGNYQDGDKNFMSNFYKKAGANEAFYSTWLSKLFFDTLNNPRPNDAFEMPDGTSVMIPYLNGGLFEKESNKYDFLTFPTDLFSDLFEFFDQYNFTIYEDSPEEHTVAVDPEMLGHIFENLLEDNKDKGAFYTPKEIVHYMTQESLIEYLHTQIPDANRNELEAFVKNKDNNLSEQHKKQIDQKLDAVKICDPAIGSGAFPMGLLQEIFGMKERIAYELGYNVWSPATVKEHIIQNSIYGVDIEQGAVDIARLRFWLSLIVDEDMPKALPNLDYKIVVGNSLVSKFEDEIIEIDWSTDNTSGGLFGQEIIAEKTKLLQTISDKQKDFFTANNDSKPKLSAEIRKLKLDILAKQLELMIETKGARRDSNALSKPSKKQLEKYLETEGWKRTLTKINQLKQNDKSFKHFDWKLDFPEVLNPLATTNIGFDIVIGNPPYIKEYTNRDAFEGFRNSPYYQGKMDLWYGFACTGLDLTKPNGVETFIAQNNWVTSSGASIFRDVVLNRTQILAFTDFWDYKVFKTAGIQTMVYVLKNSEDNSSYTCRYSRLKTKDLSSGQLTSFLNGIESKTKWDSFNINLDNNEFSSGYIIFKSPQINELLRKISDSGDFVLQEREIAQGIVPNPDVVNSRNIKKIDPKKIAEHNINVGDGVFVVNKNSLDVPKEFLKPCVEPTETGRYMGIEGYSKELLYVTKHNYEGSEVDIQNHLEPFREIMDDRRENQNGRLEFFHLHWPREERFFEFGPKILSIRKCDKPSFTYLEDDVYPMMAFNIIKSERFDLKELTTVLNSRLIKFWLYHKGKMQGSNFQVDKEPLMQIPLKLSGSGVLTKAYEYIYFINNLSLTTNLKNEKDLIENVFEEIVDSLVFELYFSEEFQSKSIEIEKHAKELFTPIEGLNDEEKLEQIRSVYEELREKKNPLRNQIKLMKIELKDLLLPILSV